MNAKSSTGLNLAENPFAPETFATSADSFALLGSTNISINLVSTRMVAGELVDVVVGRVVMPIAGAQGLVGGLNQFLGNFGLAPLKTGVTEGGEPDSESK